MEKPSPEGPCRSSNSNWLMTDTMRKLSILILILSTLLSSNPWAATLSERTYKRLTVIHELMGENKYKEAMERLASLAPRVKGNKYEYATVMQTYGFAYAATDQYKKAIKAFQVALDANALPDSVQHSMRYNLAHLHAAIPDYKAALKAYEAWFAKAEEPSADSYVFGATIYAQLKQYKKAITAIKTAISMAPKPKESWYQLLLAMYYQEKQYSKAAGVLETMVALWPDKEKYWKQLSGVYFTLKKNRKALAVLELANKRGFLTEEKELMNLVNLYLYQDIPYKGALLLEKEMEAGRIPETGKNLQKLGESWMHAKENDKALEYLAKAAEAQKKGKLFLQMAQLYADKEAWSKVIQFSNKALSAGGLKNPGTAHLLKGMAYFEQGKKEPALAAFRQGSKYPKSKKQAGQWINHINNSQ